MRASSSFSAFTPSASSLRVANPRLSCNGFGRTPTTRRSCSRTPARRRVFDWLGELPFSYDCSVPHSDPFEPQPGGCCSVWPFFVGSLVELPYALPQDHTLFTILRAGSIAVWLEQLDKLEAA